MATKKIWIQVPLVAKAGADEESIRRFTKGGFKGDLEAEVTAVVMDYLLRKGFPLEVFWPSSTVLPGDVAATKTAGMSFEVLKALVTEVVEKGSSPLTESFGVLSNEVVGSK